jgi:ribokinase
MTALVRRLSRPTGTAYVVVEESGENLIVVEPGANGAMVDLTPEELAVVRSARVVLCQLEVPVPTIVQAAAAAGGIVVLNAAPAAGLAADALEHVNVLVVNENEAETLAGGAANAVDAVEILLRRVSVVVVTRGPDGVLLAQRDREPAHVPATPARRVVDTTGAGDTFCGALAAALARSDDVGGAIRRAAVAGSLSVERAGAGESAPSAAEIKARLAELERGES